jgi:Transcription factor Iwr1
MTLLNTFVRSHTFVGVDDANHIPTEIHHGKSSGKKQKLGTAYIFSRQSTDEGNGTASSPLIPQPVRRIKESHRSASSQALGASLQSTSQENLAPATPLSKDVSPTATPPPTPLDLTPRRFHMSRSGTPIGTTPAVAGRKRKDAAVFIERKPPRSSDGEQQTPHAGKAARRHPSQQQNVPQQDQEKPGLGFPASQPEDRPRKKPGLAARSSTPPVRATSPPKPLVARSQNVRLASGAILPWDGSERLAAEMQAYTLHEIGQTLARQDAEATAEASRLAALKEKSASSPVHKYSSKFKPKKPALRYAERHPEEMVKLEHEAMGMDLDEPHIGDEDEDMDDGEYIIDTYVRIPADALETEAQSKNFGLLVLDSQPDIDEFYREEEDSEEEDDDEEEDENGNHSLPHHSLIY